MAATALRVVVGHCNFGFGMLIGHFPLVIINNYIPITNRFQDIGNFVIFQNGGICKMAATATRVRVGNFYLHRMIGNMRFPISQ